MRLPTPTRPSAMKPPQLATSFCEFVNRSPTPFHAVQSLAHRLEQSGFRKISERAAWQAPYIEPGGRYYYTRNQSSIVAFTLPRKDKLDERSGCSVAVGHVDSPCLKVRPVSKKERGGYLQCAVETYGGGIWATWFDRDLSLAGRVVVADADNQTFTSKLIKIDRPILRIPTLAIHLDRTINEAFKFNKETEFTPILGLASAELNAESDTPAAADTKGPVGTPLMAGKHSSVLLEVIADQVGCNVDQVQDFELSLYDTQPATIGGLRNEFVFAPRCDNLFSSFCSIEGLCRAVDAEDAEIKAGRPAGESNIRCVLLFDNEEVGSVSHHGAESNLLPGFIERICQLEGFILGSQQQLLANSFLLSADMGHALNPNYEGRYQSAHAPQINAGVVIKTNANQRYTSTAATTFLLRRVAAKAGVPLQEFEVRNDSTCGSTVGPHLSTHLRAVDIGCAQLSMHSIRETAGSQDVESFAALFHAFLDGFGEIDRALVVD